MGTAEPTAFKRMVAPSIDPDAGRASAWTAWLNRPLSGWWCAVGWLAATMIFMGLVQIVGGPTFHDSPESIYSTWAIAHGQLSCAYPAGDSTFAPFHRTALPAALGWRRCVGPDRPHRPVPIARCPLLERHHRHGPLDSPLWCQCAHPLDRLPRLAGADGRSGGGARATGRGRCGWEPATVMFMACFPPVFIDPDGVLSPSRPHGHGTRSRRPGLRSAGPVDIGSACCSVWPSPHSSLRC